VALDFLLRQTTYSPGLRQPRHSHDYSNVTVIVGGMLEEASDGGTYRAEGGSVVLKAAGCEHETRVSGFGARTISIRLTGGVREGTWRWFEEPEVVRAGLALHREPGDAAAMALVEAVLHAHRETQAPPPWLAPLRKVLDENFDRSLRFDVLARDAGLHPVYVARAFKRHVGMSMSEYVRAARVRHARHLLTSSRRSIDAIAGEAGFTDASHLCHTFSALLGVTPRGYRSSLSSIHTIAARRDS
jgi:AraC family transcriptional regulator